MPAPVEFWFDFSSPYGYLASLRIDAIAARHGRDTDWRPYLMGAVMKRTGGQPLVQRELVGDYARHDLVRSARLVGAEFHLPEPFPIATVAAGRTFYWLREDDPELARRFARAAYRAYFVDGRNIGEQDVVIELASELDVDAQALRAALADPIVKQHLFAATRDAEQRGICGSPWVVVDGEPFWGNDRLGEVERWLREGGW